MFGFKRVPQKKEERKTMMSQQKVGNLSVNSALNIQHPPLKSLGAVNTQTETYYVELSQPDGLGPDGLPASWVFNIAPLAGQKKRFIEVAEFNTMIIGYADSDFSMGYSLAVHQISGLMDKTGTASHVIATTTPSQISVNASSIGDINAFTVIYKAASSTWDVTGQPTLTFTLADAAGVPLVLPTVQPFYLKLNLIRVIV